MLVVLRLTAIYQFCKINNRSVNLMNVIKKKKNKII